MSGTATPTTTTDPIAADIPALCARAAAAAVAEYATALPRRERGAGHVLAARRLPLLAHLPPEARVLLSRNDVCLIIGFSTEALRRAVDQGRFPPPDVRIAGSPRWWRSRVLQALDAMRGDADAVL